MECAPYLSTGFCIFKEPIDTPRDSFKNPCKQPEFPVMWTGTQKRVKVIAFLDLSNN